MANCNAKNFIKQYKNIAFVYTVVHLQEELYLFDKISSINKSFIISFELEQYQYIFSIEKFRIFFLYKGTDYTIDFLFDTIPFYKPIYFLLSKEFQMLKEYLNDLLKKRQIKSSKSLIKTFILFVSKKDNSLRLYIDY